MGMSLEDAITHAEKIAKIEEQACFLISKEDGDYDNHKKCGEQYRQLAEWLKDYKRLKAQERCEDCISREDTLKKFKQIYFDNNTVIRCAELVLGGMSSVTPQQKTGQWINNQNGTFECSECGTKHSKSNYCPNCGNPKMLEVTE